ncbi:MAG TPA: TOBE domain-containing protein [Candidatus Obscuribacter sp.]|nr:TOBE domain-containing protein [Candidatus Obscuribacter sp.]MBK9277198.1 TOBE domain-containing protein [Candidatus Obscuribacter sp.]MBL8083220.1 TOBE domain-containing protein [Candidatus Obscuribacter sp.]HMW91634.1 TOBE domain-containing protein [Candidatus Obscuribacter sp.]HMY01818.1 TOBE domain-containing protein [Candidatus Obscuribacter sp.]
MKAISGRNQLTGRVISVKLGDIMAEIVMQVGENTITSVITRGSAESMELKVGDEVTALIKSTEVMLLK